MRGTVIRAVAIAALGVLLLTAAACGGGDDESAADTQAAAAATAGSENTTEAATTEADAESNPDFGSAENCTELTTLGTKVSAALSGTGADTEKTKEALNEIADNAPDEIKDDFQVMADAYAKIADAIGEANVAAGEQPDPEALAKLQQVATELDQTKLEEANTNITAWVTENCGGTVTTG